MKHFKIIYLLLLGMIGTQTMYAYDFMVDGLCYNKNSNGTSVTVTYQNTSSPRYASLSGAITIPETVTYSGKTYSVTSIGNDAFYGCSGLTSVTIPNSVTSIGHYAFFACRGLTSVAIGNSVTKIGTCAFYQCIGLTSVTIPNSVTSIGNSAFESCSGLTSVTIPNSVTSIGDEAFKSCSGLTSVNISDIAAWCNIDFADSYANPLKYAHNLYLNGEKVTELVIPNSVTNIKRIAFYACSGLTSVTIPNSVTSIGNSAFYACSGLTGVSIPNSVTTIGGSAFWGCSGLTGVTWNAEDCADFSSSDNAPFKGMATITSFIFGNEVKHIPAYLCYNLSGLTSVAIPDSVTEIGNSAFESCSGLTSVNISDIAAWCNIGFDNRYANPLYYAHNLYLNGEKVTELVIPNSVTNIKENAFYNCSGLTSVAIPNSVTSIGGWAFYKCSGLTSVTIGNSVTEIGSYAFYQCIGLTSVTIPNSVTSIGNSAFSDCSGLTSVDIPNSVTTIGNSAFESCSGLTSVDIPNSVTSIGGWAFYKCSGLENIYCEISEPLTINANVFSNYNATLYVFDSYIDSYKATSPWNKFNVKLDERYISSLQFAQDRITISTGETKSLNLTVVPDYYNDKTVNWTTSDETVASVDDNGQVRGVGVGTARITATSNGKNHEGSSVSADCVVQVMYPTEGAGTGDVNEDGKIDITDATLIISYLQGNTPSAVHDESLMDVTGDGDINMSDVLKVISLIRND